jgi:glucose/arabinose dehydrogenase/mono/diheme cytochrome c family protein
MTKLGQLPGLIAVALLVFTCTPPRNSAQHQPTVRPAFNPTPGPQYLSPEESMKTMHLPRGYRLELVASEPMIKEPVAIAWDGNARMYVAEMLTYMQDADATGEQQPKSRISLLEDTDNDGRMDKSTVFIDNLLLPRMMQCVGKELLVNETNTITLHSYRDTDGDGKADVKKVVYQNPKYDVAGANMEHQRSGLDWNLDNWMYMTYEPVRFRYTKGTIHVDTLVSGGNGQWGVTHDNYGRLFFSSAGGENPVRSVQLNPRYGRLDFPDQISAEFQQVWPLIATPDVQGGKPRLNPDNTLNHFTASCGQSIYRGDKLPQNMVGDYIICEPVARIIRRAKIINLKGKTVMQNAYYRQEFISSTDMNFRPVNTATGPDGNLYVVDMHRGIIQQGNWTRPGSFLRQKIDSLGLDKNVGRGRIYRVVHEAYQAGPKPQLLQAGNAELLASLDHANGWWRDNAQKELIVRGDKSVVPALKQMAAGQSEGKSKPAGHLGRIHALWTLEGLEALDRGLVIRALQDEDEQVRRTAVLLSEPFLKNNDGQLLGKLGELADDTSYDVRTQLLLSLYNHPSEKGKALVNTILQQNADNEMIGAAKKALDRNEDVRNFGRRLGNMPVADRNLILKGAATFKALCASCHGAEGKGIVTSGTTLPAPALVGSKRLVLAEKNTAVRILLHGLSGPVDGKTYPSVMPAMAANSDEWLAGVVSYIRYEFGSGNRDRPGPSPAVKPEEVARIRMEQVLRTKEWTLPELEARSREEQALLKAQSQQK